VVHPFAARNTDELTFEEDDVIDLLQTPEEGGWWQGSCKGMVGWFPSNHVEELDSERPQSKSGKHRHGKGGGRSSIVGVPTDATSVSIRSLAGSASGGPRASATSTNSSGGGTVPSTADALVAAGAVGGDARLWQPGQVSEWLSHIGFAEYSDVWEENDIHGEHLLGLDKDDLRELGVTALGHRKTIAKAINTLSEKYEGTAM
jgi:SH3/ankyrin repeat-containing protein